MVEVCSICDIAGCHHIRERTGPFTPKPDPRDAEIARLTAELEAARVGLNTAWADRDMHCRRAEKAEADLATARAETAKWHADANLMLGFAELAYEAGAMPSSSELIAARDRALAADRKAVRAQALREALGCFMEDCAPYRAILALTEKEATP